MATSAKKQMGPNYRLTYERKMRQWTQSDLANQLYSLCDEEELAEHGTIDANMVSKWERGLHVPGFFWQPKLCQLLGLEAAALGFIGQGETEDAGTTREFTAQSLSTVDLDQHRPIHFILPQSPHLVTVHVYQAVLPSPSNSLQEDGMLMSRMATALEQERLREREHSVKRRDFNRGAIGVAASIWRAPDDLLNTELLDRFAWALKKPSTIDERFLHYLEAHTAHYWQDRHAAVLASRDLLSFVREHLRRIIELLEGPLLPSIRTRLCCAASGIAQLAGHLLFDVGEFAQAREFHHLAITAAQEGENQALEAVAWGRMSFTWTYSQQATEALHCIEGARRLAVRSVNPTVRAYLAAVEAEIQATLDHPESCLKALDAAEHVEDRPSSKEEMYWLRFDRSRLAGYQGICFRRLYHPNDARKQVFLDKAQRTLTEALRLLEPAQLQRRSTVLVDIASTYAQKGDVDGAYNHAIQSLEIVTQTRSQAMAKRLLTLRQELEPWKDTLSVKDLDQRMRQVITLQRDKGIA